MVAGISFKYNKESGMAPVDFENKNKTSRKDNRNKYYTCQISPQIQCGQVECF